MPVLQIWRGATALQYRVPAAGISLDSRCGNAYVNCMRLIARSTLAAFWKEHPETRTSLEHWIAIVSRAKWRDTIAVCTSFSKAKVLNGERIRFEVAGGNYRLVVAFRFDTQIAYVKFIGTHAQYDAINAITVSAF